MTLLQSIILGLVQGLTEFLPVSSSAHLVIVPFLFGWDLPAEQAFIFNVLVQDGTLVAVIVYFWKDLWAIGKAFVRGVLRRQPFADAQARLGWYLILASIPAGILGLLIKDQVEAAFASPLLTGVFLLCTAGLLVAAERVGKRSRTLEAMTWVDALWIGAAQALAIFPGISRSGATITGGMLRNLERPSAARFSFLMSVPIMLAAGLLAFKDLLEMPDLSAQIPPLVAGIITAAVVGYLSIHWLLGYLRQRSLTGFAIYCALAGLLTIGAGLAGLDLELDQRMANTRKQKINGGRLKSIREDTALPGSQSLACARLNAQPAPRRWRLTPRAAENLCSRLKAAPVGLIGLAVLALLLAGCAQVTIQEAPPTAQPLVVDYSPAVRTWQPALYACAATLPEAALFTHEIPASRLDTQAADLALRLGPPPPGAADYAVQIGEEQIVVIVHVDNPLERLDDAVLRQLYAGQMARWGEVTPGFDPPVQVWTYPQGDETRQLFEAALFGAAPPNVQGFLAPDPLAMLEAVAGEAGALGYVPRSWLAQGNVKELALSAELVGYLRQPLLALAAQEPQGAARALLSCLQDAQR